MKDNSSKLKILVTSGACALMLPNLVVAADPTSASFGQWSASGGTIDGSNASGNCPAGFTCTTTGSGDGFLQQTLVDTSDPSNTFIQTVITETGVSGTSANLDFSDENFVKTNNSTNGGILGKQISNEAATNFNSNSELALGWANTGNDNIIIHQDFSTGSGGTLFDTAFDLKLNISADGTTSGKEMDITQDVGLQTGGGSASDRQKFVVFQRTGDKSAAGGTIQLDAGGLTSTPLSGTFTWAAGEDVMVSWLAQRVDLGSQGNSEFVWQGAKALGTDGETHLAGRNFSTFTSDPNLTPNTDGITGTGPLTSFDWDTTVFGTAPTMP